jgi:hypothetical protein
MEYGGAASRAGWSALRLRGPTDPSIVVAWVVDEKSVIHPT